MRDERRVVQVVDDDLAGDRVRERDVGAHVDAEPQVGPLGGLGPPRVDRRSATRRCGSPSGRGGRRSDAPRARSIPTAATRSVCSTSSYELVPPPAPNTVARPTTDGACQVRLQLVDVVAAEDLTAELPSDEVHLVRGLRAAEHPRPPAGVALDGAAEPLGGPVEGLVPGGRRAASPLSRTIGSVSRVSGALIDGCSFLREPGSSRFYVGRSYGREHRLTAGAARAPGGRVRPERFMMGA